MKRRVAIGWFFLFFSVGGSCAQLTQRTELLLLNFLGIFDLSVLNSNSTVATSSSTSTISVFASITYSASAYTFTNGAQITSITPTVSHTITSCSSSPALPTGLSLSSATCAISGTPTENQIAQNYTISAITSVGRASAIISITVNSSAPTALVFANNPFVFTRNSAISTVTPTITGTVTGCSATPSLPTGLSISETTCAIGGTPTALQTATDYTITASNSFGSTNTSITITVNVEPPSALTYSSATYTFTKDLLMTTQTPTVTGTITSCSSSPSLPAGLLLNNSTCAISGTPTALQTSAVYTITATNSSGSTTATVSITINDQAPTALNFTTSPFTFTQNATITTQTPTFTGTVTSCSSSPSLPAGLAINNTTCAISGTPTGTQSSTGYTITATNSGGNTTANITITINLTPPSALTYSGSPYTFTQNATITTQTPTVTGTVTSCSISPAIPAGLAISSTTCAISGTPTGTQSATAYTVTAGNANGSTTASINITINIAPPSALTYSGSSYTFTQNETIATQTPTVTGTVTGCSSSPGLPAGLSIQNTTCAISGTPTGTQSATTYTITASNATGSTTATISITVNIAPPSALSYSGTPFTFTRNGTITSINPTVTGTPSSYSVTPTLPTGLSINTTSGQLAGTPTDFGSATGYNVARVYTVTATNSTGSTNTNITITISATSSKAISTFSFVSPASTGFITGSNISVTVPSGTIVTALVANFNTSGESVRVGATTQVSGTTANNFSSPVTYTVTAADGSTANFIVTVTVASNTAKELTSFSFPNSISTTFTGTNIAVTVPNGTNRTTLVASFITTGASVRIGGTTQTSGVTSNNFSSSVSYVVTAGDATTQTYIVTVTAASNTAKDMVSFGFSSPSILGSISGTNIAVTVPFGTTVTNLVATFSSSGTSVTVGGVSQISGSTPNDFSSPTVTYRVIAQDNSFQDYTVTVTIASSVDSAIVNGSFQSGTLTNVSTTTTATLSRAVDLSKSFVYCGAKLASSDLSVFTTCQLTGPTTISIVTGAGTSTNTVNWYVIEYANGVRVQRGSQPFTNSEATRNITLTATNLSKSFALVTSRTSSTSQTIDGQRTLIARLTTSTNLLLQRQATGISLTAEWQVVEFSAGNVQAGYVEIPGGASSVTDTIPSSVDTSKSFLFFSSNGASSQNGVEFDLYTRGTITNSTTVTFRRKGTTGVNQVAWYVIEMTDGTTVQRGTTNVGGAITTEVQSITNVNVGKSMIVWTNDTGLSGVSSHQDSGTFSARFSSTTQIEFERQNSESNPSSVDWFVVAFQ